MRAVPPLAGLGHTLRGVTACALWALVLLPTQAHAEADAIGGGQWVAAAARRKPGRKTPPPAPPEPPLPTEPLPAPPADLSPDAVPEAVAPPLPEAVPEPQ